ncbi:MAG: pirin family protein [Symploca sp. SIO3C6]|uniref:Pirin family protein n=1 Tax=Symploca sp. SIO1C4 TaxID=2607765 RepID=A0A6B3NJD7_9CYAN|nr:pirin family protein [Symploca sp. SIO3C6]NER30632.1 pirin family protein [Symploca sp. SIO1C4]NET07254.1 pirin family protein [Symploca sp. SIO2B6]
MAVEKVLKTQKSADTNCIRPVVLSVEGLRTSDGDGVKLRRFIGSSTLPKLDPFLLLDAFSSDEPRDYLGGFPEHPHRGFETVTYVLAGRVRHQDNKGNNGVIEAGGVQWMTAGRGIVHSEMPEQQDGLLSAFQLWVNLPAAQKMTQPQYQEFSAAEIPIEHGHSSEVRVIAGETSAGTVGPVKNVFTEPIYFDVTVRPQGFFMEKIPPTHNSFIIVYEGSIVLSSGSFGEDKVVEAGTLAVLGAGNRVNVTGKDAGAKFLLIAGKPLNEPIAHSGPFVMNTRAEVMQAFQDFWAGRF